MKDLENRCDASLMWTIGAMGELERLGLIRCPLETTPKGTSLWDQLDASGFRPTDAEIEPCLLAIGPLDKEMLDMITVLLKEFRDHRQDMIDSCCAQKETQ